MSSFRPIILAASFLACSATPSLSLSTSATDVIGKAVVDFFKSNPKEFDAVLESVQKHHKSEADRKKSEKVSANKNALFTVTADTPIMGNKDGKTEMVVFMDPFCGFCRKFKVTMREAIAKNKDLKIIGRDIAILHEKSVLLIRAQIAANLQGKYEEMQKGLYKVDTRVDLKQITSIAKKVGMDAKRFLKDIDGDQVKLLVKRNMDLADAVDITATPTFIIKHSGKMVAGAIPLEALEALLVNKDDNPTEDKKQTTETLNLESSPKEIHKGHMAPSSPQAPKSPQTPSVKSPSVKTPKMPDQAKAETPTYPTKPTNPVAPAKQLKI